MAGLEAAVDQLRRELRELVDFNNLPGFALGVSQHGKPLLVDFYGLGDLERGKPMTQETLFRQFSMTKAIVSVCLMTFYDEGRVSLDDPVSKFLGPAWGLGPNGLQVTKSDGIARGSPEEPAHWHRSVKHGDTIFLRAVGKGAHIDVDNEGQCRCRWDDPGDWQALRLEEVPGASQPGPGLRAALRAHTGRFLDVTEGRVVAAAEEPVPWLLETDDLRPGQVLKLRHASGYLSMAGPSEQATMKPQNGAGGMAAAPATDALVIAEGTDALEITLELQTWELDTVPAEREITIRNLLTHTSGLDYSGISEGKSARARESIFKPLCQRCHDGEVRSLQQWADELAALPLACQPGTRFLYGFSTDVLGRVVEVLGSAPLDEVIRQRVTAPLGMKDTVWSVGAGEAQERLACLYEIAAAPKAAGTEPCARPKLRDDSVGLWSSACAAPILGGGGGVETLRGGMLSTMPDYLRFCQMLTGGRSAPKLLRQETLELTLHVNHLGLVLGEPAATMGERRG